MAADGRRRQPDLCSILHMALRRPLPSAPARPSPRALAISVADTKRPIACVLLRCETPLQDCPRLHAQVTCSSSRVGDGLRLRSRRLSLILTRNTTNVYVTRPYALDFSETCLDEPAPRRALPDLAPGQHAATYSQDCIRQTVVLQNQAHTSSPTGTPSDEQGSLKRDKPARASQAWDERPHHYGAINYSTSALRANVSTATFGHATDNLGIHT